MGKARIAPAPPICHKPFAYRPYQRGIVIAQRLRSMRLLPLSALAALALTASAHAETIVLYSALDFAEPAAKAFAKKTGNEVKLVSLSTGELLGKVSAEGRNPQFDLLWVEGSAVMARLASEGILKGEPDIAPKVKYTAMGKKLVPANFGFYPASLTGTAIAVNTKKVDAKDLPKSWADLEKFAPNVAAKDPNFSGPAFQWLAGLFQTNGEAAGKAMLAKVLTNKALSGIPSGGQVNKLMLAGDAKVAIQQDSSAYGLAAKGEPVSVIYPTDGAVALPSSIGVAAASKNEATAKAFIEFVLSAEGQAAMLSDGGGDSFFDTLIEGVSPKAPRVAKTDWVILDNEAAFKREAEWKKWYRDTFVP